MNWLSLAITRLRRRASGAGAEAGMTLAEVLVTVTILGISVTGIVASLGSASMASDTHRKQVTADTVVRGFAEAIKEQSRLGGYLPLASVSDWGAVYSPPAGYKVKIDPSGMQYESSTNLNVVLLLDRSTSIPLGGGDGPLKSASKAFLNSLKGTGAYAALVSFGTASPAADVAPRLVTDAAYNETSTGFKDKIDNLNFGSSANPNNCDPGTSYQLTNWDAGLLTTANQLGTAGFPTNSPPLVVMVTDGNPNRWVDSGGITQGSGCAISSTAVDEATTTADRLRAQGARLFVVGVDGAGSPGDAPTTSSLKQLTHDTDGSKEYDPVVFPGRSFSDTTWTTIDTYPALGSVLSQIAIGANAEVFSTTKPISDQGTQKLTLVAYTVDASGAADGRDTEILDIIVRRP